MATPSLGPAVQPLGVGHVGVFWQDGESPPTRVVLTSPGRPDVVAMSTITGAGVHQLDFAGLVPGAEYRYTIDGNERRFIAPPDQTQSVRFMVIGDSRTNHDIHRQLVRQMAAQRPDFYVTTGDDVQAGDDMGMWRTFFEIEQPLMSIAGFVGVRGNHDVGGIFPTLMRMSADPTTEGQTYGAVDIGPVHLCLVDSESDVSVGSAQRAFIERDLAAHANGPLVAVIHRPLYSTGVHGGAQSPEIIASLGPLFQRYGVDLVLQGHDHHYERSVPINGVTYLVTGGGGAPLYHANGGPNTAAFESVNHFVTVEASPTRIDVTATRLDGSRLDQFTIDPAANNGRFTNEPIPVSGGHGCSAAPGRGSRPGLLSAVMALAGLGLGAVRRRRRERRTCAGQP